MIDFIDSEKKKAIKEIANDAPSFNIRNKMEIHYTRKEEQEALERYYSPNTSERRKKIIENQIVKKNLGLVTKMAWQLQGKYQTLDVDELISAGLLGFVKGLQKFDMRKGYRLSTYLTWWIRDAMYDHYSKQNLIEIPTDIFYLTLKYRNLLREGLTLEQIRFQLKPNPKQELRILDALGAMNLISFDQLISCNEDSKDVEIGIANRISPYAKIAEEIEAARGAMIGIIGERNFNILEDRYCSSVKVTLKELAEKYKSKPLTIRESINYNIAKLRRHFPHRYPALFAELR
jgi:RNA polymerase sigma factor (sigma-70 family)